jgi:16S rRNA (guanine1207-N2)-methyltransferase
MSHGALDTLFLPFEKNVLTPPPGRVAFWGARAHPALVRFNALEIVQPFYPDHAALHAPEWTGAGVLDMALVLLPKQKEEALGDLATALDGLKPGGILVAAAANDAGGTRIEGWMKELGLIPHSLSKNKARVCWAEKTGKSPVCQAWRDEGARRVMIFGGQEWTTQPGIFGWDRVDAGSLLLAAHIPSNLKGRGADFGCGYGYLSRVTLAGNSAIERFSGIDADRRAVDCAAINAPDPRATFTWADLSAPVKGVDNLDFIVMNPPFHTGKLTQPSLGKDFIRTARGALRKGGMLYMVANAQLDYEAVLGELFSDVKKLTETNGFKVIAARA